MKKIILMCLFGLMFSQTELTTRVYELSEYADGQTFFISDLTGYNFDYYLVQIVNVTGEHQGDHFVGIGHVDDNIAAKGYWSENKFSYNHPSATYEQIFIQNELRVITPISTLKIFIAITAEFPEEDTGYIEEGFDFCLASGNNLVAFPCKDPVSVNTALPDLAQSEIESIIGAGDAAININGQFQGSLSNFTPGKGYWFKSESSFCFNYSCAE